jgi:hypothetical protein
MQKEQGRATDKHLSDENIQKELEVILRKWTRVQLYLTVIEISLKNNSRVESWRSG